jgi:hypothetical protein
MHDEMAIPMAGIALPLILVPTIMGMKHVARKREYQHLERMKALELGRPLPGGDAWASAMAIAIGAVVPLGSILIGWLASLTTSSPTAPWEAAGPVAGVGVVCGFVLGWRLIGARSAAKRSQPSEELNGKPIYDPEAYEFVGHHR